jgi:hypothetical protein
MGQFKPMVKMETTEPSVILKLKKGGHVNMKKGGKAESGHKKMAMGGGAMAALAGTPALLGRPAVNAPVQAPGKPSMAMRRQAMMAKKPAMPMARPQMPAGNPNMPPAMKKGGKMEHDDAAQDRAMIKKAMAGEKFATGGAIPAETASGDYAKTKVYSAKKDSASGTGGVKNGNAGGFKRGGKAKKYASGGAIPAEESYGNYDTTKVYQAKKDTASGTKGVRLGNAGGFQTGGVAESNGGGYRKGGATKKAYATGGTVNSGRPVAMPQGRKKPSAPVSINQLAGTFKNGGRATSSEARLLKANAAENASSMRSAKKDTNLKYGPTKRMQAGGSSSDFDAKAVSDKASRELEEALNPLSMAKELYGKVRDSKFVKDIGDTASDYGDLWMKGAGLRSQNAPSPRAVTKTKESVTVSPAGKKRGGRAC